MLPVVYFDWVSRDLKAEGNGCSFPERQAVVRVSDLYAATLHKSVHEDTCKGLNKAFSQFPVYDNILRRGTMALHNDFLRMNWASNAKVVLIACVF